MKCNIDVVFSTQRNHTDIGICLRDEGGTFVLARATSFGGVHPIDIGEALGLHLDLQWVSDLQLDNIDFEVDSENTQEAIYSSWEDISEFGNIITTFRVLLSSKFVNSRTEFVMRQANAGAYLACPTIYFHIPNC